jgi:hypothetical protein
MLPVSLRITISGNEWLIMRVRKDSYASGCVPNGVYIDRRFEGLNNYEDRLMKSVADLRTQLCEEEHKLCDWHGTVRQRLDGWVIVGN